MIQDDGTWLASWSSPHLSSFTIAQITARPLIAALSVNAVDCFHGQWHVTVFQSFNVFCATKNYSYFIKEKCSSFLRLFCSFAVGTL